MVGKTNTGCKNIFLDKIRTKILKIIGSENEGAPKVVESMLTSLLEYDGSFSLNFWR